MRVRDRCLHVEKQADRDSRCRAAPRRNSVSIGGPRCARAPGTAARSVRHPASTSRAICGCVKRARIVPSRLKRASPARPTSAAFSNFTATRPSKRPSLRVTDQTLPMPPWPIGDDQRVGPHRHPGQPRLRAGCIGAEASRKPSAVSRRCSASKRLDIVGHLRSSISQGAQVGLALYRRKVQHAIQMRTRPFPAFPLDCTHKTPIILKDRKRRSKDAITPTTDRPAGRGAGRSAPSPSHAAPSAPRRPASKRFPPARNRRRTSSPRYAPAAARSPPAHRGPRSRAPAHRIGTKPAATSATSVAIEVISNSAAALLRLPPAHVIDDQSAHHPCRIAHEAVAIGKARTLPLRDIQIGLVQQRVAPSVMPAPRFASSRRAMRCNSSYSVENSLSAAARSPCSAEAMSVARAEFTSRWRPNAAEGTTGNPLVSPFCPPIPISTDRKLSLPEKGERHMLSKGSLIVALAIAFTDLTSRTGPDTSRRPCPGTSWHQRVSSWFWLATPWDPELHLRTGVDGHGRRLVLHRSPGHFGR